MHNTIACSGCRVQIQADDIDQLVLELWVVGELERLDQMGFSVPEARTSWVRDVWASAFASAAASPFHATSGIAPSASSICSTATTNGCGASRTPAQRSTCSPLHRRPTATRELAGLPDAAISACAPTPPKPHVDRPTSPKQEQQHACPDPIPQIRDSADRSWSSVGSGVPTVGVSQASARRRRVMMTAFARAMSASITRGGVRCRWRAS